MADKNKREEFSEIKLAALAGIYSSDGLQVVFDIMEGFCNQAENEFLATNPVDPASVLATHAILHAQRIYFQSVVGKIDKLMEERAGSKKDNRRLDNVAQLLSVLPMTDNEFN